MTSLLQGIDQVTADDIAINKHDKEIDKTKDARNNAQLTSLFNTGSFGVFARGQLLEKQNIITTTKSHSSEIVRMAVDACRPTEVVRVGGAGKKVCYPVYLAAPL